MRTLDEWALCHGVSPEALAELHTLYRPGDTDHSATSEGQTSKDCERLSGQHRQRLWRNNSGAATDERTGRVIRYGLGNTSGRINAVLKSSDYIGITTIIVQPHHVGQRMGIFTALEMKHPTWHLIKSDDRGVAQANYLSVVEAAGGIGQFITDAGQYVALLKKWGAV